MLNGSGRKPIFSIRTSQIMSSTWLLSYYYFRFEAAILLDWVQGAVGHCGYGVILNRRGRKRQFSILNRSDISTGYLVNTISGLRPPYFIKWRMLRISYVRVLVTLHRRRDITRTATGIHKLTYSSPELFPLPVSGRHF